MPNLFTLRNRWEALTQRLYARLTRGSFRSAGYFYLHPTARIDNPQYITLGKGARIDRHVWIYAMDGDTAGNRYTPEISIGDRTRISDFCHITGAQKVAIGSNVLITRNVLISDSTHVYEDITKPIVDQGLRVKPVSIGDGCWIGNNAAILGCTIGKNCVIGANSVVTRDIPDFCAVGGVPARVLKRYDEHSGTWVRGDDPAK